MGHACYEVLLVQVPGQITMILHVRKIPLLPCQTWPSVHNNWVLESVTLSVGLLFLYTGTLLGHEPVWGH